MLRVARIIISFVALVFSINAQSQWVRVGNGISGGGINSVLIDQDRMFVCTSLGDVYVSADSGLSWMRANNGLSGFRAEEIVSDGINIYVLASARIFWSSDKGANWQFLTALTDGVSALTATATEIFAANNSGSVYKSTNKGVSWTSISSTPFSSPVRSIQLNSSSIFVVTYSSGVFRSDNNGGNWTLVSSWIDPNTFVFYDIAISGNSMVMASSGGSICSFDGGQSWTSIQGIGEDNWHILTVAVHGTSFFLGTFDGKIYRSQNGGVDWQLLFSKGSLYSTINDFAFNGSTVLAGSGTGILLSVDGGNSWIDSNSGIKNPRIGAICTMGDDLYASVLGFGVLLSEDNGATWIPKNSGLTYPYVQSLLTNGDTLLAGTAGGGIFKLKDKDAAWIPCSSGLTSLEVTSLVKKDLKIYAGTRAEGVFISSDDGSNWSSISDQLTSGINSIALSEDELFAYGNGLFHYQSNTSTWGSVNTSGFSNQSIYSVSSFGGKIFVGTLHKTYVSADFGTTWEIASSLPDNNTLMKSDGNSLLASTSLGVYLLKKSSDTWQFANANLPLIGPTAICLTENYGFVGTYQHGIWSRPIGELQHFDQIITLNSILGKTIESDPFVPANASSGLTVTVTSNSDKVSISGNTVTPLKEGRVTLMVSQEGNADYNPAQPVSLSFCISPVKPIISVVSIDEGSTVLSSNHPAGNQWFKNFLPLEGATEQTLTIHDGSHYQVQTTIEDCSSEISSSINVVIITGTEPSDEKISVYPNPAADFVYVVLPEVPPMKYKLEVFNSYGQRIDVQYCSNMRVAIPVVEFSSGIYLLRVTSSSGSEKTFRFIKG